MRLIFTLCALLLLPFMASACANQAAATETGDPTKSSMLLPNAIWVESLDLTKMSKRGKWATNAGKSTGGAPMSLAGIVYPHGVGMHAPGGLVIAVNGKALRFISRVGVDDERPNEYGTGSIVFEVWVDGKLAKSTAVLRQGQSELLDVDLRGANTIELLTMDGDDGSNGDHADWAGAQLVMTSAKVAKPETVIAAPEPAPVIAPSDESMPRLNGAKVVGATPGRPFVYRLPVSGPRPLKFTARGLPRGLSLDPKTGILRGSIARAGTSNVKIVIAAKNVRKEETLTIIAGANKLALTPPMGWSSWNALGTNFDGAKIKEVSDALVATGLANFGYQYVNIDDGWTDGRDESGHLRIAAKMGDFKKLANHIHGHGLRFGVYSSPGPKTCGNFEGSLDHELKDAQSLAQWEVDYFKHDWCSYEKIVTDESSLVRLKKPFVIMGDALKSVDRDIVYALCQYGLGSVWKWGGSAEVGGQLWRTTGDLTDTWGSMWGIGFSHHEWSQYAGPGGWNDPDMLVLGVTAGWEGKTRPTRLSQNEQIVHFTQWSMLASPLILGFDPSTIDAFTRTLVTHEEVIAIDQDPLGKAATRILREGRNEVWVRPLQDGTIAVALYNLGWKKAPVEISWEALGLKGPQKVRDVWQRKDLGSVENKLSFEVPQHGALLFKVGQIKR